MTGSITPSKSQEEVQPSHTYYDYEDVAKHNTETDAWIVVKGGVYDVTNFLGFHPGGRQIIVQNLGTDVTEAFLSPDIHSHSEKAFRLLEKYRIGGIDPERKPIGRSPSSKMDDPLMSLVDMEKPTVWQIFSMEPTLYQKWLHSFPTTMNMRLFESSFCESLSRYPWWYIFPLWIPVISLCIVWQWTLGSHPIEIAAAFCGGLLFWSILEYTLHRWMFHMETSSHFGNWYHFMAHGIHHVAPLDPTRLTFPPVFSVFLVALVFQIFASIEVPLHHTVFSGGLCGFMLYDALHFTFHHGDICQKISYCKWMRSRHFRHHYVTPDKNFGVSSPIWDIIFGTCE